MKLFHSLKIQLTLIIGILVVLILGVNAYLLIRNKSEELNTDIYRNAVSFSNLTVNRVMDAYNLYFKSSSFTAFHTNIFEIFKLNSDIYGLEIVAYPSKLNGQEVSLIRYGTDTAESEIGTKTDQSKITDPVVLNQIRLRYPSVRLAGSDVVYGITDKGYIDLKGNKVAPFQGDQEIQNVVFPYTDNLHSVIYYVSYNQLNRRIQQTSFTILMITIGAMIIAVIVGYFLALRITKPVKVLTQRALDIAKGDFTQQIKITTSNEIGILAKTFNKMTDDLANYQRDLIEKERINEELRLAGDIQQNLLPKILPQSTGLDIAAGVKAAVEVGGDVYDFIPQANGDLLFYIGDVTGHGVPASLIASITNTLIFTLQYSSPSPREIALMANHVLYSKTRKDMFVTMIIAKWEQALNKVTYTCAGHDQMLHYHARQQKATLEPRGGVALGLVKDINKQLQDREVMMETGDFVLMYSDGIPEALNPEHQRFSMDRLVRTAEQAGRFQTAQQIFDYIIAETNQYMRGFPQADDITLIVLKKT